MVELSSEHGLFAPVGQSLELWIWLLPVRPGMSWGLDSQYEFSEMPALRAAASV